MDWEKRELAERNIDILNSSKRNLERLKRIQTTPTAFAIKFECPLNGNGRYVEINPLLDLKLHIQLCKILQQHYTDQINRCTANLAGLGVTNYGG